MSSKVSVIIVNYNGAHHLDSCLNSLYRQSFKDFEIIVVDNNSSDDSVRILEKHQNRINLIELKINTGFAGGNNIGYKFAKGEYIVTLNNDTEVAEDWLERLVFAISENTSIGMCASNIVMFDSDITDSAGDGFTTSGRGVKLNQGQKFKTDNKLSYIFGACAGAALYRKKMIEEIGFFDEDFYLIHEDTDLSFRAQLLGWKCIYVPNAIVKHKVSSTIGIDSDISIYYSLRNTLLVWLKNMPKKLMLKYFHHVLVHEVATFFYYCFIKKKWDLYFKSRLYIVKNIKMILRKRIDIMKKRKVTNEYIDSILIKWKFGNNILKSMKLIEKRS
jgi:hypothetical protein